MSGVGWGFLRVVLAFLAALALPAIVLVVATGLLRTGMAGVIAFSVLAMTSILFVRTIRRGGRFS